MKVRVVGELIADAEVRGVQRLLEPDGPPRFVEDLRLSMPIHGSVTLTVLKQRPGQRALIRIDAEGEEQRTRFYAKLLRRSREGSEDRRSLLRKISERAASVGVHVPAPLAYLPRFKALVFEPAKGRSLLPCCAPVDTLCTASSDDTAEQSVLFSALGKALSRLHLHLPQPETTRTREFERRQIERNRPRLAGNRPDLREQFDGLVLRWWNEMVPAPSNRPIELVPLHGDLYPAQVLVEFEPESKKPRLAILDWDAFCAGEAERDLGNFEAHLILERIREHLTPDETAALRGNLDEGYRSHRELNRGMLDWYRRGTILRLAALYADPSFGPHPPNPPALTESLLRSV